MSRKGKWRSRRPIEEYIAKRDTYLSRRGLGKKESKKRKAIRIKNRKLCKQYPWLIPRNVFTGQICWGSTLYDITELDNIPNGWRKAFGDIWCEEIDKAIKQDHIRISEFRIEQLKEKYGMFRQYIYPYSSTINHVTNAFEVISEHICIYCGALDAHVVDNYGWWMPLCKECYDKINYANVVPNYRVSYEDRVEDMDEKIPESYTIRSYVPEADDVRKTTYDISDIVTKIRYKNKRRTHE